MSNFSGRINLMKLKNSAVVSINGRTGAKKCVVIPIDDNHLFVSADENNKAKGVYMDFIAWENRVPLQSGDTHGLKMSLPKDVREKMTADEQKNIPFIGNMKPYEYEAKNSADVVDAPQVQVATTNNSPSEDDDLPF